MKRTLALSLIRRVLVQSAFIVAISMISGYLMFDRAKLPTDLGQQTAFTSECPVSLISFEEFRKGALDGSIVCVDARNGSEFEKGHVRGAISLPLNDFDHAVSRNLELFIQNKPIAIYCSGEGCDLSRLLARKLITIGINQVSIFTAGWNGWKSAGLPIEP